MSPLRNATLSLGLALAGCGGGGGGAGHSDASAENQLLAFVTAAGELKTFDPRQRATGARSITTDVGVTRAILGGDYRPLDHGLDDPHHPVMLFLKQGRVFRLGLLPADAPVPEPVSDVTDACQIVAVLPDFAHPADSRVLVSRAGPDTDCGVTADNLAGWFRVGADAATAAIPVATDVLPLHGLYGTDGALTGVLAQAGPSAGRSAMRYDAHLQNAQTIVALEPGTAIDGGGPRPDADHIYLRLRGAGTDAACLHRYTVSSDELGGCLHEFAGSASLALVSQADAGHVYLADTNRVLRVAHAAPAAEELLAGPATYVIGELRLSAQRVVISGVDTATGQARYRVESLPRAGGAPVALKADAPRPLKLHSVTGNRVYFADDGAAVASAVLDTGDGRDLAGTRWSGFTRSREHVSLGAANAFADDYHGVFVQAADSASSVLRSFNAVTGAGVASLGLTTGQALSASSGGFGRYRLLAIRALRSDGQSTTIDVDVYFADTLDHQSLLPLAVGTGSDRVVF